MCILSPSCAGDRGQYPHTACTHLFSDVFSIFFNSSRAILLNQTLSHLSHAHLPMLVCLKTARTTCLTRKSKVSSTHHKHNPHQSLPNSSFLLLPRVLVCLMMTRMRCLVVDRARPLLLHWTSLQRSHHRCVW